MSTAPKATIDLATQLPLVTSLENCDGAYFQSKASEEAAMLSDDQKAALAADLNSRAVKHRSQAGRDVSYIEGWWAISEANRIFGFDGWSSETVDITLKAEGERPGRNGAALRTCTYTARVRITVHGGNGRAITREGVGAGHGMDQDAGQAHEKAIKEAETDARKRALMTFGNQFGLALYDKEQRNVSGSPGTSEEEPKSVSRVSPPSTIIPSHTRWDREREQTSKRHADQLISGPLPAGQLSLAQLRTALDTAGGSRTRAALNKWVEEARKRKPKLTQADYSRVMQAYEPLDVAIKASFEPVTEAAE